MDMLALFLVLVRDTLFERIVPDRNWKKSDVMTDKPTMTVFAYSGFEQPNYASSP